MSKLLSCHEDAKVVVELFDLNGRCVLKSKCTEPENKIDISLLESGTYIAHYISGDLISGERLKIVFRK